MNEALLIGNLTKDPEVRNTNSGARVVTFTLATNERWKDADGNRKERSEFHRVVIFNEPLGEIAEKYLRKGSRALVRGAIQTRKWTDQNGQEKYSTEVVLQKFNGQLTLLDKAERSDSYEPQRGGGGSTPRDEFQADLNDEIPFISAWGLQ